MGAPALLDHRPLAGRTARAAAVERRVRGAGGQDLAPPRLGPGRALRRVDDRALVLPGPARSRPGGRAARPAARRRGRLPQPERGGHRGADRPVPRASGLDGAAAPGQPARGLQGGSPTASSPVASYATVRRYLRAQGMHRQARPKRATEGAVAARDRLEQLEVRSFEVEHVARAVAPGLPPRLAQGAHPRRRLGQADAAGRHRRPLAPGVPPAVVPRRDARRAWCTDCRRRS